MKKSKFKDSFNPMIFLSFCFFVLFAFCVMMVINILNQSNKEENNYVQMSNAVTQANQQVAKDHKTKFDVYEEYHQENEDMIGWIKIADTHIDYPVMQKDNEYYVRRNFKQEYSIYGTPFLHEDCTMESNNLLIYGHSSDLDTMFSDLLKYKDVSYYEKHSRIELNSLTESNTYEVIGAFYSKVYEKKETDVFRYYDYVGDLSEERYVEYLNQIQHVNLYGNEIECQYGEQLLTLSTCSNHTENGRFVVVAKRVDV